jgi:ElaB/YqjD/DUF883 family membrane-anchored ribosome-binding protein
MSNIEQLERETEQERARIAETLEELRARITPGRVVDQLVDYASDSSGGMFFRNLRRQAVDNPIPVALVSTGLAWLALSGRRDQARSAAADLARRGKDAARETADAAADKASSGYAAASELGKDATSRAQAAAQSAMDAVGENASATYDAAADRARRAGDKLQESASQMRGKVAATSRNIMDFVYEQPLVLVGLGVAIGAAIGAASPSTAAERELMGETSDAVKEKATGLAREQMQKGQAVAEQAWQSARQEAEKQGLGSASEGADSALASHQDAATNEIPLAPSSEAPAGREEERSKG